MSGSIEVGNASRPSEGLERQSVLVADDDPIALRITASCLSQSGYEVVTAMDGETAIQILGRDDAPRLAVLDWMMPGLHGIDVCRRLRESFGNRYIYLILLTSREERSDVIAGLEAGADDYLTKPFDPVELCHRVRSGERILRLQQSLERHVEDLEDALAHVKRLQGLLPICMHCKSIRDDANTWHRIEAYLNEHGGLLFTHSLCQDCLKRYYPDFAAEEPEAVPGEKHLE